ncbi:DUF2203 domain-containing protein [Fontisphaera persica]|uniref:DUF2203 domain-containing protein n=1 Tax=Fontisphaera persica TaxID=2974023 RepID=UPI0024C073CD|nr:DUF2203 domain-containing protein [Fontisphaera persica]WCJ59258.1 DUF2203 domain-containing protein [Fontisphaera persica]
MRLPALALPMHYRFTKHYTLDEARALLPQVRQWLTQLQRSSRALKKVDAQIFQMRQNGEDLGGPRVCEWVRLGVECMERMAEFQRRQILVKDIERGLVDFPSLRGDREVFLCWEMDEDDIQFWHDLDAGYAGREAIEE